MLSGECPKKQITATTVETIELMELAEQQVLPVAGGSLDQSYSFTRAFSFYTDLMDRVNPDRHG